MPASSRDTMSASERGTRQERKQRTRRALLGAALDQLEERSFGALSLREVARQAGITPTGFYRHFASMEELGLTLVEESFTSLREMIRAGRQAVVEPGEEIRTSVAILVRHVHEHRAHFRFIARERSGGVGALRDEIRREIALFTRELVRDLRGYPVLERMEERELRMIGDLLVVTMVATAERLLDAPVRDEATIQRTAEAQMRLIVLGALGWHRQEALDGGVAAERVSAARGRPRD